MDGPIKTTTKLHLHVVKEVQILLFEFPYLQSYNSFTLLQNLKDQILTTNVWIEHVSFEIILIKVIKSRKQINSKYQKSNKKLLFWAIRFR